MPLVVSFYILASIFMKLAVVELSVGCVPGPACCPFGDIIKLIVGMRHPVAMDESLMAQICCSVGRKRQNTDMNLSGRLVDMQ